MVKQAWLIGLISLLGISSVEDAIAQVIPDNTLGSERSTVFPTEINSLSGEVITGGARRGGNLFHSFEQFSVQAGKFALFNNDLDVRNVISRVTGSSASQIDGILATNGTANLFLLNPKGITFGREARLIVNGSFLATTANALELEDQAVFSASDPASSTLLSVDPSAFLFNQIQVQPIVNQSRAPFLPNPSFIDGLRVGDAQTLVLLGGDVTLDGGGLAALKGRIELGGLSQPGRIALTSNQGTFQLVFPSTVQKADVVLKNQAFAAVDLDNRGDIAINANNIDILTNSSLRAGIREGSGDTDSKAGDITLKAAGRVTLSGRDTLIFNTIAPNALGTSGNIIINAKDLQINRGAQLQTLVRGRGIAGNVRVDADRIEIDGEGNIGFPSGIFSTLEEDGIGIGGDISIQSTLLSLTNGATILANTRGQGDAGNIEINVRDQLVVDGEGTLSSSRSSVLSGVETGARGNGGNLTVTTRSLTATRGGRLNANSDGIGKAGNVQIKVFDQFLIDGTARNGSFSGAFSVLTDNGEGQGGTVTVEAGSIVMKNGARISASTLGSGDAGNVNITVQGIFSLDGVDTRNRSTGAFSIVSLRSKKGNSGNIFVKAGSLSISNGAKLATETEAQGNAGSLTVQVDGNVTLAGGYINSGLQRATASGTGGAITLNAGSLRLLQGGQISASTTGQGDTGIVKVNADSIEIDGQDNQGFSSGIINVVDPGGQGDSKDIEITTNTLRLSNNGIVSAKTVDQGNAGNITISARDRISIHSGGIFVSSTTSSQAGNITLTTPQLTLDAQGTVSAASSAVDGGNVTLNIRDLLLLRRSSLISASAGLAQEAGNGGNITLTAPTGFLVSAPNENSDIVANAFSGSGGRVNINTKQNFWISPLSRGILEQLLGTTDPTQLDPSNLTSNNITAISQVNPTLSGQVSISAPDVDLSSGLAPLPSSLTDPTNQISQACSPQAQATNSFIRAGRGGIPEAPGDRLTSDSQSASWVTVDQSRVSPQATSTPTSPPLIIEAQTWKRDTNGDILLIAQSPVAQPAPDPCVQH